MGGPAHLLPAHMAPATHSMRGRCRQPADRHSEKAPAIRSPYSHEAHLSKMRPVKLTVVITTLAVLLATCAGAQAQQFSAGLVRHDAHGLLSTGTLSVSGGKVRIQQPNLPFGFFIIRGAGKAAYFVNPEREVFTNAGESTLLTELLVPVDPADPCSKWQMRARLSGSAAGGAAWHCDRLDDTRGDGVLLKYALTSPHGKHFSGWIDPQLRFLVRLEADNGITLELRDVRQAPQPDSLFEFPVGFSMFDAQRLIDQMKHSDAYVDPSMDSRAQPVKPPTGPGL